jgi:hypothetical protein
MFGQIDRIRLGRISTYCWHFCMPVRSKFGYSERSLADLVEQERLEAKFFIQMPNYAKEYLDPQPNYPTII